MLEGGGAQTGKGPRVNPDMARCVIDGTVVRDKRDCKAAIHGSDPASGEIKG